LAALADEPRTLVFFEAPHRLAASLGAMASAFGADRSAAVCRELTKTYEEVRRGELGELARWAANGVRGEITVVVAGAPETTVDPQTVDLAGLVAARQAAGADRKSAIAAVAVATGLPKRTVYEAVVAAKGRR
jgi:16S rRNA (cytidine1402-2'-O)-methyltransferase